MATKELKRYQEKAVEKLTQHAKELLESKRSKKTIVFQSPTGSGKTFMMSAFIEELITSCVEQDLCFLWISIGRGKLHEQSYRSLKKEFGYFPEVHLLENEFFGSKEAIEKNEVVVVNWDKLNVKDSKTGEWKNTLMKDSETYNFRDVVKNTREEDKKIVLIIDESHTDSNSQRAIEIRDEIIKADLTIEMSATPDKSLDFDMMVKVSPEDVIEEGMIKKEILINEGLSYFDDDETSSEQMILKAAYSKRHELASLYKENDINVNPLVLIQLPSGDKGEAKRESIEEFLGSYGVTEANGKLAIWLSEEKINLELLNKNNDDVEFLIFKQAISTGWDCPRAQILVRFREIKSLTFNIQTVGRILRMAEGKHYQNDMLNRAYVYVNTLEIKIDNEGSNPNIIKNLKSTRKEIYGDLKLRSYYRNRIDFGDITASFYSVMEKVFCEFFGIKDKNMLGSNHPMVAQKIDFKLDNITEEIMRDTKIKSELFDTLGDTKITADATLKAKYNDGDLDYLFEDLIRENLNGYAPKRSLGIVESALFTWFDEYLGINDSNDNFIKMSIIMLRNRKVFSRLLDEAVKAYKPTKEAEKAQKIAEIEMWNDNWEIAQERRYNPTTHHAYAYKRSLYEPCYLMINNLEESFIDYLERDEKVLWWWQNGSEHMALNFGIKYGVENTFQPDFIVAYNDGRIGIFDTKAIGVNENDNRVKNEALQAYIKEENAKGKHLFGGLVVKDGVHFRLNQKETYTPFKDKPEEWEYFYM